MHNSNEAITPCFYRLAGHFQIFEGLVHRRSAGGIEVLDIRDYPQDIRSHVKALGTEDPRLLQYIEEATPDADGLILVPEARPALVMMERIRFKRTVQWDFIATIEAGTTAICGQRDAVNGSVSIGLEGFYHPNLPSNILDVRPFHGAAEDGLLEAIEPDWKAIAGAQPSIVIVSDFAAAGVGA